MKRETPTDAELLSLFCALVAEYDSLGAAFPSSVASFELSRNGSFDDAERWNRIVRAMALRKFVWGHQDDVRADKVVTALQNCLTSARDRDVMDRWHEDFRAIGTGVEIGEGGERPATITEVLEDLIYGSYLHGDLARWRRNTVRSRTSVDLALWKVSEDAEYYVRRLRTTIILAAREGRLTPEAAHAVLGATAPRLSPDADRT